MMDEPVPVLAGDVVTGAVVLQRNPVWRRHMSVTLSWSITSAQDPALQKVRYLALDRVLCSDAVPEGGGSVGVTVVGACSHPSRHHARTGLCCFSNPHGRRWTLLVTGSSGAGR